jgi:hypothetical protein
LAVKEGHENLLANVFRNTLSAIGKGELALLIGLLLLRLGQATRGGDAANLSPTPRDFSHLLRTSSAAQPLPSTCSSIFHARGRLESRHGVCCFRPRRLPMRRGTRSLSLIALGERAGRELLMEMQRD